MSWLLGKKYSSENESSRDCRECVPKLCKGESNSPNLSKFLMGRNTEQFGGGGLGEDWGNSHLTSFIFNVPLLRKEIVEL